MEATASTSITTSSSTDACALSTGSSVLQYDLAATYRDLGIGLPMWLAYPMTAIPASERTSHTATKASTVSSSTTSTSSTAFSTSRVSSTASPSSTTHSSKSSSTSTTDTATDAEDATSTNTSTVTSSSGTISSTTTSASSDPSPEAGDPEDDAEDDPDDDADEEADDDPSEESDDAETDPPEDPEEDVPEDPEPDITPLEVQPVSCHESFKHHDVHRNIVKEGSKLACISSCTNDLWPRSGDEWDKWSYCNDVMQNLSFEVWWIDGCETSVESQSPQDPMSDGESTCGALLTETYDQCNNGGAAGTVDVGCLRYSITVTS